MIKWGIYIDGEYDSAAFRLVGRLIRGTVAPEVRGMYLTDVSVVGRWHNIENIQYNGYGAPQYHCVILWECVDGIIWVQYTLVCMNTTSLGRTNEEQFFRHVDPLEPLRGDTNLK